MSAIAGVIHLQPHSTEPELGTKLMDGLSRYKADAAGQWTQDEIFLGCLHQRITPQSVHEEMPYYARLRGLAIAADAIIDNRNELMEALGVPVRERPLLPDSQLILLAYGKWGSKAPQHLVGDFAFLIWDEQKRSLFGARDFSGNRTLYLTRLPGAVAFCTVIHPLLALPGVDSSLSEDWISEFLAIPVRIDATDSYATVYRSVEQLPPAHSVTVTDGRVSFERYCFMESPPKLKLASNAEYEEAFREVFGRAVRDRLRTRHAVGANLSGGLDSGSVVSFAAEELGRQGKKLHTFSSYPVDGYTAFPIGRRVADERPYINRTIEHVGNIEPSFMNFPERSPYTDIDDWLELLEMPYKFIENSYWLKGIYEQAEQKGVGVLLSGQRGNWTISWGPALDYQAKLLREFRWLSFLRETSDYARAMEVGRKKVLAVAARKAFPMFGHLLPHRAEEQLPQLIHPELARRTGVYERLRSQQMGENAVARSIYAIRRSHFAEPYIWNVNGTVATKLSLKYGVWDRDPTNDLRVIRFCLSVPEEQYVQHGMDRSLIRRAMKGRLPDEVRLNRTRRGVQGADGISRMLPHWPEFLRELSEMLRDPAAAAYLNLQGLSGCLSRLGQDPKPQYIFSTDFRLLARGLVFYRFLKSHA